MYTSEPAFLSMNECISLNAIYAEDNDKRLLVMVVFESDSDEPYQCGSFNNHPRPIKEPFVSGKYLFARSRSHYANVPSEAVLKL